MEARLEAICQDGDLDAFHQLLQEDSLLLHRPSTTPSPSNNPLHIAALLGHAAFAGEILRRRPELAQELNEQGFSPLHLALANGHLPVVKELLKAGSDLCLIQDKNGCTPIHTTLIKGKICIAKELINACPEAAKVVTCQGETVLHFAVKSNYFEAVKLLVEMLADDDELLNLKDENGNTILHFAVARKQLQVLKFLLSKPMIQVNSLNLKGFTPLDVLLESPSEHGDLVLGEMIRAAGGKKADEVSPPETHTAINPIRTSPTSSNWIGRLRHFFHQGHRVRTSRRYLQAKRGNECTLMVVATLITTVTFEAGLHPPEILGSSQSPPSYFSQFMIWDVVGLFASLSVIMVLLCVPPSKKRILMKVLKWLLWIAFVSTAIAFMFVLAVAMQKSPSILIFAYSWYLIAIITLIWLCIRFSIYLLRKAGWLKKKEVRDG